MKSELNEEWLLDMRHAYLATADDKVSRLSQAIHRYVENPSSEERRGCLHRLLHNLIGSGGSYGFPEVSSIARNMSDILKRSRSGEGDVDTGVLLRELEDELTRLRLAFDSD